MCIRDRLDSPRVEAILQGRPAAARFIQEKIEERIPVPASIHEWKASEADRERALSVQLENRRRFQQAFSQGLAVVGFTRDAEGNGIFELGPLTPVSYTHLDVYKRQLQDSTPGAGQAAARRDQHWGR